MQIRRRIRCIIRVIRKIDADPDYSAECAIGKPRAFNENAGDFRTFEQNIIRPFE